MNSRISKVEERWLLDRDATAAWEEVDPAANLYDADPMVIGGLYHRAESLYGHFLAGRPKGIHAAKISKCLYLVRPALFPILDSRVRARYRRPARTKARQLTALRGPLRHAYWAAIRDDICLADTTLAELRQELRRLGGICAEAADRLRDVRLMDILAWKRATESSCSDKPRSAAKIDALGGPERDVTGSVITDS